MMGLVVLAMSGAAMAAQSMPAPNGAQSKQDEMSDRDQWACTVAMCMAAPGGAQSISECSPPMERLRKHLAKGKPFPVCRFLGGGGGNDDGDRDGGGARRDGGVRDNQHDPLHAL